MSNCIHVNQLEMSIVVEIFDTMLSKKRKGTMKSTLSRGSVSHESSFDTPMYVYNSCKGNVIRKL